MLTLAAFLLPIAAGLAGTLLPAFGWLPALGGNELGLAAWRVLFEAPGFATAWKLTIFTGWAAAGLSLLLAVLAVAFLHHRPMARRLGEWMAPMLAMPHSALAIGFAFLILPSGWLARALSPGITGWDLPPDVSTVGHPSGWPLVAALLLKEVPYLVLMILGALNQVNARAHVAAARALGYGPVQAWVDIVLPQIAAQIRLPVYAVLAFSLSVVDVALILGPGNPPTLAVLAVRWFGDPDTRWVFPASAAATLLLLTVLGSIALWFVGERGALALMQRQLQRGVRGVASARAGAVATAVGALLLTAALAAMLAMWLWSFAAQWRWPAALPTAWTLDNWQRQAGSLAGPALTTLAVGAAATLIALVLVLACLENEVARARDGRPGRSGRSGRSGQSGQSGRSSRTLWLLYLPLLVPQVAFLFGLQVLLVRAGADGRAWAVVWAHLVFVLPYLFLSLADPWRAFDERYARSALALGATRWRVFWRIKLPILLKPLLLAAAVAFAVSVGQYLPTLFAGAGRVATLTTEAITLSGGADRRVIATWALLQAAFPLIIYLAAAALPRFLYRHRKALA
jgi:putative thiamine transport system permease protein